MEYPKINSLWKREGWYFDEKEKKKTPSHLQSRRQSFIVGDYACEEFASINRWQIDEKIDGTNIRIIWEPDNVVPVQVRGRTDRANIPSHLLNHLQVNFTRENLVECFPDVKKVVLYGEGYGPKIQAVGSQYRDQVSFILFDVWIDGWWLQKESVIDIAKKLGIEHTINQQIMTTQQIIDFVASKPKSYIADDPDLVMEGVIARAYPLMLFRQHRTPIMFKLKVKDMIENIPQPNESKGEMSA